LLDLTKVCLWLTKDSYRYGVLTFTFSIGKGGRSES